MPTMLFTAFRRYAVFNGRAQRKEYWQFVLLSILVGIVAGIIDSVAGLESGGSGPATSIANLVLLLPTLSVSWRRFHDLDRPGWHSLAPLLPAIPLIAVVLLGAGRSGESMFGAWGVAAGILGLIFLASVIWVIVQTVKEGTPGPNRYGPDPKGRSDAALADVFR